MAQQELFRAEAQIGNDQQGTTGARAYAWMLRQEANSGIWATQGLPPGGDVTVPGYAFRASDSGYTCPSWPIEKAIRISSSTPIGVVSARLWNMMHIIGGYPGYNSAYATTPTALDVFPPGLDNNGVNHTSMFLQFQVQGGGTYDPAIDWYRGTSKAWYTLDIAYDSLVYLKGSVVWAADGTGSLIITANGSAWFTHSGPTFVAGVPGFGGTNGQSWGQTWEGVYQACDGVYSREYHFIVDQTLSRVAQTVPNLATDSPTVIIGTGALHSVPIAAQGGVIASSVTDLGTTIDDAGFGGTSGTLPANTVAPKVTGTPQVGSVLNANDGTWTGSPTPTLTRKWQLSSDGGVTWADIAAQTGATYTPVATDVGKLLRILVTGSNASGTAQAASAATSAVTSTATSKRVIGNTSTGGSPAPLSVNKKRGGEVFLDVDCTVDFIAFKQDGAPGEPATATQKVKVQIAQSDGSDNPSVEVGVAQLAGTEWTVHGGDAPGVTFITPGGGGITLTGGHYYNLGLISSTIGGTGGSGGPVARAFFDTGVGLLRFEADTYATGPHNWVAPQVGDGVMEIYMQLTPVAANTQPSAPTNSVAPSINNVSPQPAGSVLTCNPGTWTQNPSLTYQWQRSNGGAYTNIAGATGQAYTVQSGDIGYTIRCNVTGTNTSGTASAASNASIAVTSGVPVNTTAPALAGGIPAVGFPFLCGTGVWTFLPEVYTFQWQVSNHGANSWTDIDGATNQTYAEVSALYLGKDLRCGVIAINSQGASTRAYSAASSQVALPTQFPQPGPPLRV